MKIAILSRFPDSYSTSRLVEAAKARGHAVRVIDYTKCYVEIEKSQPTIHYMGERLEDIDAIIPRIGFSNATYGAAVVRQFEMMRVFSTASSLALVRSRDKLRSLQLLARGGIGIPRTVFARKTKEVDDIIKLVGGAPLVVKLTEGTQGIGVVLAETKKAATSVLQAFYGIDVSILAQEFIEESNGSDIRALIIGNEIIGGMKRQGLEGEFRSNIHRGGQGEQVELTQKERNIAVKAARVLGLPIAGVDIIRSNKGPLVLEVNSSPGLEGVEAALEMDVASKFIEYIEENAGKKRRRDRIGA